eukprot:Skav205815  [mRNA]  locus=scaffold307:430550:432604:+ [translate_table: standard]
MKPWRDEGLPGWAQLTFFELAVLTALPCLVGVLMSYLFASTYHGMPVSVWLVALALLAVCLWHARHETGSHHWHSVLPISCMSGVVDGSTYCVAPIVDAATSSVQFFAAGIDCCSRGKFECDDAWDEKAHAGLVLRHAWHPQYALAVKQAAAAFGLTTAKNPLFVQWVVDPEKVEMNYWMLGNGILVGSCLISLVISALVLLGLAKKKDREGLERAFHRENQP